MNYNILGKTGIQVSKLGFGAASLGSMYRDVDESEGIRAVHTAFDLGINYFDVSPFYGGTAAENVLGKALKTMPRDKYLIATKTGRFSKPDCGLFRDTEFDFSRKRIFTAFEESCRRLHVDYLDFLQLHDIENVNLDIIIEESIPALVELKRRGKIRCCGITGYPLKIFREILTKTDDVDTILTFCHYSMNDNSLLEIMSMLKEKEIGIVNASVLSMGLLTNSKKKADWHPAPDDVRDACRKAAEHCLKNGTHIAKLALQYSAANDDIHTILLGTADPEHVKDSVAFVDEPIDETLIGQVLEILEPIHNEVWLQGLPENN